MANGFKIVGGCARRTSCKPTTDLGLVRRTHPPTILNRGAGSDSLRMIDGRCASRISSKFRDGGKTYVERYGESA